MSIQNSPLVSALRAWMGKWDGLRKPGVGEEWRTVADALRSEVNAAVRAAQVERTAPVTIEQIANLPQAELDWRFRQQAQFWGMADNIGLCRTIGGRLLFVDTTDFTLSPHLMVSGFWEIWITQAMARVVGPGMVVADVGANLGYYTVLMAEAVGPTGRVIAFEPNPAAAGLLARTISLNGFGGYTGIDTRAVPDRSGENVYIHVPAGQPMNAAMVGADHASAGLVPVTTVALDDVLPSRVDFLKIDVEGAEYLVWSGLANTIGANPHIKMFLEVNASRQADMILDFLRQIQAAGFVLKYIDTDSLVKPCSEQYVISRSPDDVILMLERDYQ